MPALVDANVWLPILCARHSHHAVATAWWNAQAATLAETARLTLVTFDSGFRSFPLASLQILQPE